MSRTTIPVEWTDVPNGFVLGYLEADGIGTKPAPAALQAEVDDAVAAVRAGGGALNDEVRAAIRNLLRTPAYKPTGRGKPASEYLVAAAERGDFPAINALVDINNLASLQTGWPWSVIDRDRALGAGAGFEIRRGRPGEEYVFNSVGQSISLEGLLLVARQGGEAFANPVKDAMLAKTTAQTSNIIAFAYTHESVAPLDEVQRRLDEFGRRLSAYAGATHIRTRVMAG